MQIGTLLRAAQINESRVAFFKEIGLNCFQIAGIYEDCLAPTAEARKTSDGFFELFEKYGFTVPSMFLSYLGQDWKNPRTGIGLVPEHTRAARMLTSCRLMEWCKRYDINLITCHAGMTPEVKDEFYGRFIADMKQLVRFAASLGQEFLFETGTESVANLKQIMDDIDEPNVGINFDPANLLIYNTDDPAVMVETLADRIKVVHCKDANPPAEEGVRGKETVLGAGSTNFAVLLKRLIDGGFNGPLIIERELQPGPEQEKDITEAVKLIKSIVNKGE